MLVAPFFQRAAVKKCCASNINFCCFCGVLLLAELPNCRTAELPNCRTAELQNCRIDGYFLALLKQTRGFCHLSKLNQFHQNRNGNFLSHKVLAVLNLKSCS